MPNGLAKAEGVAIGIDKATKNLLNIMVAKEEWRRESELFGIKKKQSALEIKKLEGELSPEVVDLVKRKQKVELETAEVDLAAKELEIEQSRKSITDVLKELQDAQRMLNLPGYREGEGVPGQMDYTLPEGWSFEREVAGGKLKITSEKEKRDYLLKIPPKELEAKKKGFWSQFGDAMLRNITGGLAGDITEASRTATIEEVKRKYKAGEDLSADEATLLVINSIKTKQDIEELLENREQYEGKGVDVERILEFFTTEEE